jgi:hypothetical protein
MEPEGSVLCTQGPSTSPYPESDQFGQYNPNVSLQNRYNDMLRRTDEMAFHTIGIGRFRIGTAGSNVGTRTEFRIPR